MRCELCGTATSMPEPLQQCAAWLSAYFCEPSRTQQLPLPPFHHPMLQRGQCPVPGSCRITEGCIGSTHTQPTAPHRWGLAASSNVSMGMGTSWDGTPTALCICVVQFRHAQTTNKCCCKVVRMLCLEGNMS